MGTTAKFEILFEMWKLLQNSRFYFETARTTAKFEILFEMWELLQSSRFYLKCGNYCKVRDFI
ncbi:hypothetical protein LIMHP_11715 [Leptospira interrogans serovar Manilae]|nr:hypothetical protein LIMLP_11715 [Leptospira interrogans serovar Manilae]AKP30315.1 hypothetical protein LIMHP_11715 [Leptospira interrogans serovar Manilae]EYU62593.1 hypothetical protein CI00_19580 [Leptospira interrogans serovar Manilae]